MDLLLIPLLLIAGIALLLLSLHGLPSLPAPIQEAASRSARRFASAQEAALREEAGLRTALGRLEGRLPLHRLPLHDPLVVELLREIGDLRLEVEGMRAHLTELAAARQADRRPAAAEPPPSAAGAAPLAETAAGAPLATPRPGASATLQRPRRGAGEPSPS